MNTSTSTRTHHIRRRRHLALALPVLAGAALLLGACSDDDTSSDDLGDTAPATVVDTPDTIDTPDTDTPDAIDTGGGDAAAGGSEPAQACGLLDPTTIDSWLGTSGVTGETDTSLGLYDGCRWATARTDVPALIIGYGPTMEFAQVRDLACDGTTPEPAPAAGADAVACFGAVIAPAGAEGIGVVLTSVEDPTSGLDDAARLDIATRAAAAITAG